MIIIPARGIQLPNPPLQGFLRKNPLEYKVKLPVFEGPLDLLLHLIKEQKLDIYDIPISEITRHYLEYLDLMTTLNLDIAGDYMVMAAELARIKSKMLLPVEEAGEEEEEGGGQDPRAELVEKLLEYKKYKEAALELRRMETKQGEIFTRKSDNPEYEDEGNELLEVTIFDLLNAFKRVLKSVSYKAEYEITVETMSVTDKMSYITSILDRISLMDFESLFRDSATKMEIVTTFLALLELIRLGVVRIQQLRSASTIKIYKVAEEEKKIGAGQNQGHY